MCVVLYSNMLESTFSELQLKYFFLAAYEEVGVVFYFMWII